MRAVGFRASGYGNAQRGASCARADCVVTPRGVGPYEYKEGVMKRTALGLMILLLALAGSAAGQELTGSIEGVVMDPAGAVIPGAKGR